MKHQFINANKIVEAIILEPITENPTTPFNSEKRGWQVVLVMGYSERGEHTLIIDRLSEQDCLNFCNELGLRFVF